MNATLRMSHVCHKWLLSFVLNAERTSMLKTIVFILKVALDVAYAIAIGLLADEIKTSLRNHRNP